MISELIKADIDEEYNSALNRLSKDDRFYDIIFDRKNKTAKKKRTLIDYLERKEIAYKNNKIKNIIDFDDSQAKSIKSLAVEVKTNVTVTTRFMKGKMLMFAKTSLQGFVYDMMTFLCTRTKLYKQFTQIIRSKHVNHIKIYQTRTVHL